MPSKKYFFGLGLSSIYIPIYLMKYCNQSALLVVNISNYLLWSYVCTKRGWKMCTSAELIQLFLKPARYLTSKFSAFAAYFNQATLCTYLPQCASILPTRQKKIKKQKCRFSLQSFLYSKAKLCYTTYVIVANANSAVLPDCAFF